MGTSTKPAELSELEWRAFCYIGGELSSEEATEFENVLAEDQMAREAVAAAVEMSQEISVAHQFELVRATGNLKTSDKASEQSYSRRISWLWVSLSVGLVVASGWLCYTALQHSQTQRSPSKPAFKNLTADLVAADKENEELALEWNTTRLELQEEISGDDLNEDLDEVVRANQSVRANPSLETPSWMLAALAQSSSEDSEMEVTP